jgi:hypothetical protein
VRRLFQLGTDLPTPSSTDRVRVGDALTLDGVK